MQKRLYLTGIEKSTGKSFISLGIVAGLLKQDPALVCHKLFQEADDTQFPLLEKITGQSRQAIMSLETALHEFCHAPRALFSEILDTVKTTAGSGIHYFEGTNFDSDQESLELQLNFTIAAQIGADLMLVVHAKNRTLIQVQRLLSTALLQARNHHVRVLGVIINLIPSDAIIEWQSHLPALQKIVSLVCLIPEFEPLSHPNMGDIAQKLHARILFGHNQLSHIVRNYAIAAKNLTQFLESRLDLEGILVITPADRTDILLGSLLAHQSAFYPKIAGIVLTGGEMPSATICSIIEGLEHPFPVLLTEQNTFSTATALYAAKFRLHIEDYPRVEASIRQTEPYIYDLVMQVLQRKTSTLEISPALFLHNLKKKAAERYQHIVLPEGEDPRVLEAAAFLLKRRLVRLTILGNPETIQRLVKRLDLDMSGATILDHTHSAQSEYYAEQYCILRSHKPVNMAIARERMLDPNFYAAMMVYTNTVDGMVSGAIHTTADTVRAALEIIKTKPGVHRVSSVFVMCLPTRVLLYGDCAINPEPDAPLLAAIAVQAAEMAHNLGLKPRVALLSYSSGNSGKGASVDKVVQAMEIVKASHPELHIEGPIQYDAAVDMDVAKTKLPHSRVAGRANVLIFPDLNTGNNTYKAVQRETGALAIGPVLLGLQKPVSDLSRGCSAEDIINTILITALQ